MNLKKKIILFLIIFCAIVSSIINYKLEEYKQEEITQRQKTEVEENIVKEQQEEIIKEEIVEEPNLMSLGEFKITAYCPCSICCGKWSGSPTASGVMPKANHTIAVDTSVIQFGTKVVINGTTYTAEDTGSAIKGNKIDIYFNSHQDALNFGVQYAEVFIINK